MEIAEQMIYMLVGIGCELYFLVSEIKKDLPDNYDLLFAFG
jgi:hypothetical protein